MRAHSVTGGAGAVRGTALARHRTDLGALLFVLGLTAVCVSYGPAFGGLGRLLIEHQEAIQRVLGAVTIRMGLAFLGLLPALQRDVRIHRTPVAGLAGAPLLGVMFGVGWTPCIGLPFLLDAVGVRRGAGAVEVLRRHSRTVTRVGGTMLILIGLLLLGGWWDDLTIQLRAWAAGFGTVI